MVASEASPWAKTGGLADVAGALPAALDALGHRVSLVMPAYAGMRVPEGDRRVAHVRLGAVRHTVELQTVVLSDRRRLVLVDAPALYGRSGLYGTAGRDFDDNAERFAVLAGAALDYARDRSAAMPVDVIHAHDWQAGLVPTLVRADPQYRALGHAALVFTIHNLAYQGLFAPEVVPALGLPWSVFTIDTGEFWGRFSFLKAGITYSDYVTTVSPRYAGETRQVEFGAGMDGVLSARADRYVGILNGIDTTVWNPATDPFLPTPFDAVDLARQGGVQARAARAVRAADRATTRWSGPSSAWCRVWSSRRGWSSSGPRPRGSAALDATWVFVGTGEPRYEQFLRSFAAAYPTRVAAFIGFEEPLAHLVEAGADMFLMPSIFEPCGLNQMYSLRYGTVPVVRAVGGLDDTVRAYSSRAPHANGFKFRPASPDALVRTLRQAVRLYRDKAVWDPLVERSMRADHSWQTSAREYVRVYRRARRAAALRVGR